MSKPAPDGRTIVRERLGRMWFVDNRTGRETPKRPKQPPDLYHDWSLDSAWLLSWRDGGRLRLWETATGRLVAQRRLGDTGPVVPAFSPSSHHVYVNAVEENRLLVLYRATLKPARAPIDLGTRVLAVEPHPDDGSVFAFAARRRSSARRTRHRRRCTRGAPRDVPCRQGRGGRFSQDATRFLGPNLSEGDDEMQLIDATTWERFGAAAPGTGGSGPSTCPRTAPSSPRWTPTGSCSSTEPPALARPTIPLPAATPEARITYLPDSSGLLVAGIDGRTWTVDTRPGLVGGPGMRDRRPQPHPRGVEGVLPQPGRTRPPVPSGRPAADPPLDE